MTRDATEFSKKKTTNKLAMMKVGMFANNLFDEATASSCKIMERYACYVIRFTIDFVEGLIKS